VLDLEIQAADEPCDNPAPPGEVHGGFRLMDGPRVPDAPSFLPGSGIPKAIVKKIALPAMKITSSRPFGPGNGWLLMRPLMSFRKSSRSCHLMASNP
jgi:hypothetical protein